MKEGWTYKKLGEVANVIHGKNQKDVLSEQGQYPIYGSGGNIMGYANDYLCEAGTTILGRKGSINNPLFIEERFWNVDTAFGISAKEGNDSKFVYYFITSVDWLKKNTGTTLPSLTQQVVKSVELPVPSLSEQQRIVSRLDSAFAHIDERKANAEKLLSEARALFQKALTKAMEPKEGWEEKTLKETCSIITDGTHHSPVNTANGKYKYVTAKNIKPWGLDLSNITFVTEDVHKEIISRCCPQKGDVLYIKDGATTGIAIVNPLDEEFSMLSSVALIRPRKDLLLSEYLCYALNSPSIYEQTRSQMDGAAITRVTLVKIKGFTIPIPPLSEQQRIVSRLDSLSAHVRELEEVLQKTIAECDALKQALLRQVFE